MKKIIVLILVLQFMFCNFAFAREIDFETLEKNMDKESVISLKMELNKNIDKKNINDSTNKSYLCEENKTTFNVNVINNSKAEGKLTIDGITYDVVAEGKLNKYTVVKEDDYAFGVFYGYIKRNNKIVELYQ